MNFSKLRKIFYNIVFVIFLIHILLVIGAKIEKDNFEPPQRNTEVIEKNLRFELNKIVTISGSTIINSKDLHKNEINMAYAGNSYKSNSTYDEIRKYYNEQFVRNGWLFSSEKTYNVEGYNEIDIQYQKEEYKGGIFYSGFNPHENQTYSIYTDFNLEISENERIRNLFQHIWRYVNSIFKRD